MQWPVRKFGLLFQAKKISQEFSHHCPFMIFFILVFFLILRLWIIALHCILTCSGPSQNCQLFNQSQFSTFWTFPGLIAFWIFLENKRMPSALRPRIMILFVVAIGYNTMVYSKLYKPSVKKLMPCEDDMSEILVLCSQPKKRQTNAKHSRVMGEHSKYHHANS